jgi:hypothetical protein
MGALDDVSEAELVIPTERGKDSFEIGADIRWASGEPITDNISAGSTAAGPACRRPRALRVADAPRDVAIIRNSRRLVGFTIVAPTYEFHGITSA